MKLFYEVSEKPIVTKRDRINLLARMRYSDKIMMATPEERLAIRESWKLKKREQTKRRKIKEQREKRKRIEENKNAELRYLILFIL